MTTWHDVTDIEKQNSHLVGEVKDAKSILKEYLNNHQYNQPEYGAKCNCSVCVQARAWLARNKQA